MDKPTIQIGLSQENADHLIRRLQAFNDANHPLVALFRTQTNDPAPLHIFARDGEDNVIGGVIAKAWITWKWLEIDILWVDEPYRSQKLGSKLMDEMEQLGRENGCTRSRVSTWSFQAPEFYQKRGYEIYGELHDFPEGITDYRLWKNL